MKNLSKMQNPKNLKVYTYTSITLLIYLFINCLFVYKYTLRHEALNAGLLTSVYFLLIIFLVYLYHNININEALYRWAFWFIFAFYFIISLYINLLVDGNQLNIDRWSAMDVAIESILNNQYPYSANDHLGGRTSNLPTIILYGMPFYLMGDVGYLQSFGFIVFSFILFMYLPNYKSRTFGLLLTVMSISYLYEIYTKSDLITNFIFLFGFVIYSQNQFTNKRTINTYLLASATSMLLLTRVLCVIPLSLVLFKEFINWTLKKKIAFICFGLGVSLALIYFAFHNYKTIEILMKYNPLELQNRQIPLLLSLVLIILPLPFSFLINNIKKATSLSIVFMGLPIFAAFFIKIYNFSFNALIEHSIFDITYFNTLTPFIIYYLASNNNFQQSQSI